MTESQDNPTKAQTALGSYIAQANNNSTASVNVYRDVRPRPVESAAITTAHEQLACLPSETFSVPPTQPVAARSRLPLFERNPFFVGRQSDLQAIAQALKAEERATIVISGIGGLGKTQLASEVIFRYGGYFAGGVFWLNFADAAGIPSEIAACRLALQEELRLDLHTLPLEEQVTQILAAWQSDLPRLLIFDNCEEEALLATWRPPLGGCRILVTSHRATWARDLHVHQHPLSDLHRAESIELLGKYRPDLTTEECNAIAEAVGDLPLALHLAGNYLEEYRESRLGRANVYLTALSNTQPLLHSSLQAEGTTYTTRHIRDVARTFALSYEHLDAKQAVDALAITLLAHAAYFAPGVAIPRELLRVTVGPEEDNILEDRCVRALKRLAGLGLLEISQGTGETSYRLHRLLAGFVRIQSQPRAPEIQATVEKVVQEKATLLNSEGLPTRLLALQPHLRFITNEAFAREDAMAARLCNTLGFHLYEIGAYPEALRYVERALAIRKRVLSEEHLDTATSYNNLAELYQEQGRHKEAEPLYQQALTIYKRVRDENHPDTAISYNNLAGLYHTQGRYEEAESFLKRALAIREQALGENHPDTAQSYNNLAELYHARGRYEEAEPFLKRALAAWEQVLGKDHPTTAISYNNLAELYRVQGRYGEAEPFLKRALAIWEQALGENHPDRATSYNNLALLYLDQGRYEKAEPFYKQALAICKRVLGEVHSNTATSYNNLAELYRAQGRYEEAEPLYKQALLIREQLLGENHPNTATSYNNLALLYRAQGRYEEAEPFYKQALTICQQVLGEEHPNTAASYNNLAGLYQTQGRYEEAELFFKRALAIYKRALGEEHFNTAASYNNLAGLYQDQGRYEEAESFYRQALAICKQILDEEHPAMRTIKNNYDKLCKQIRRKNLGS